MNRLTNKFDQKKENKFYSDTLPVQDPTSPKKIPTSPKKIAVQSRSPLKRRLEGNTLRNFGPKRRKIETLPVNSFGKLPIDLLLVVGFYCKAKDWISFCRCSQTNLNTLSYYFPSNFDIIRQLIEKHSYFALRIQSDKSNYILNLLNNAKKCTHDGEIKKTLLSSDFNVERKNLLKEQAKAFGDGDLSDFVFNILNAKFEENITIEASNSTKEQILFKAHEILTSINAIDDYTFSQIRVILEYYIQEEKNDDEFREIALNLIFKGTNNSIAYCKDEFLWFDLIDRSFDHLNDAQKTFWYNSNLALFGTTYIMDSETLMLFKQNISKFIQKYISFFIQKSQPIEPLICNTLETIKSIRIEEDERIELENILNSFMIEY